MSKRAADNPTPVPTASQVTLSLFPIESIRAVIGFFRGDATVTWQTAAKAALDILRYGLDQVDSQTLELQAAPVAAITEEQAINNLETLANQPEGTEAQMAAGAGMWSALLPVLAQLLGQWLARRSSGQAKAQA